MEELSHQQKRMISRGSRIKQGTSSCLRDGGSPGARMLSTPPSTPHELCLSSASADRYEGHGTREYALAAEPCTTAVAFLHGRRHASALCALQRRAVVQIAPHVVVPSSTVPLAVSRSV
jgi:hypothetical protein